MAGVEDVDDLGGVQDLTEDVKPDLAEPPSSEEPDEGLDRIVTVPNVITLLRLACIPLFLWLLFGLHKQTAAAILLAVLGATDWVDGYVARRFNQVSTFGKVLDPTADRLLVGTAVISVMVYGAVPLWFGIATIVREVLVSVMVLLLASLGAARIDVLWVGKAGTFGLMFAYPTFLLAYGGASWQAPITVIAYVTGITGLVLAWIAAGSYIGPARKALREGRAARQLRDVNGSPA
ncbi:MAG TPA: CDP-alcohol phosphatidyltransferase family protein [Acidimicrobiales bacterium]|jgi:cardiolipin synthase|nr:CDP-alcohol phosphatidyltransferase family protein [Acidimicrobiales bacterium]